MAKKDKIEKEDSKKVPKANILKELENIIMEKGEKYKLEAEALKDIPLCAAAKEDKTIEKLENEIVERVGKKSKSWSFKQSSSFCFGEGG